MNNSNKHMWMQAASFAARKHQHQYRKDGATPYAAHPFRVAMVVREVFGVSDEEVLAAALLHDTIEDTDTDYDEICEQFGPRVADIVAALTKDMWLPEERREPAYDQGLADGPSEARLIKLADVYDNISDAPVLTAAMKQKLDRICALVEGDEQLRDAADKLSQRYKQLMGKEACQV